LGSQGAALVTKEDQVTRLAAPKINAVDTTGAGDCLIGSFAGALLTKVDVVDALKIAITCASESVTRSGAQSSYPSKDWVKKLLP
ncbi:MAG: ribokinase, partial [Actinobacteria bacterium]|nr:ribokinase [Actinomycetota bacterium]